MLAVKITWIYKCGTERVFDMQEKLQQLPYYKWLIFGVVSVGVFMATMTASVVNVALPPITAALHTDIPTAQWVVTAYLLAVTSMLPLVGRLGDVWGRRFVYGLGFIGFTAGSLLCGMADSIAMLIGFRIIQAAGAATLMANGMAIVTENFPACERGKVLGLTGTIVALGSLCGPGIGGVIVEMLGWHAIFYINIPIGLLGYAGVRLILPFDRNLQQEKIDYLGAGLFTASMVSLLLEIGRAHV
jgi:MFS family permease